MADLQIGLQLYTVRDLLAQDFAGTLRRVKEIGYDVVQPGGGPMEAQELKKLLDDVGLVAVGPHVGLEQLEADLNRWIDFAKTLGTEDLVCPWLPEQRRRTADDWLAVADVLNNIGTRCREQGVYFSYHNHSFEFVEVNGQYALDLLLERTEPSAVYSELDTYWVKHGGEDPVAYIKRYAGRIRMLHVKDMADDAERSFAEVGRGILDWPAIHQAAQQAGVLVYCVEQDICPGDPIESARISREFLRQLTGV